MLWLERATQFELQFQRRSVRNGRVFLHKLEKPPLSASLPRLGLHEPALRVSALIGRKGIEAVGGCILDQRPIAIGTGDF